MYVYIQSEPGLWTVGHYTPAGKWVAESDHQSEAGAAGRVHYLNGGSDPLLLRACKGLIVDIEADPLSVQYFDARHIDRAKAAINLAERKP